MTRVRSLEGREAGVLAGIIQGMSRLALGRRLNPIKVQAHAPRAMLASFLSNLILGSGRWALGRDLLQLVRIRVAARNGCPFWIDINAAVGGRAGLSRETIEAALGVKESRNLSERERIALEYADRISAIPVDVPDEFFANLARLFSEREIVELTAHIAHENYNAKSNRPLRVEANNFCEIPAPQLQKSASAT
jgi:AhpD family alkylhydroperoxidase